MCFSGKLRAEVRSDRELNGLSLGYLPSWAPGYSKVFHGRSAVIEELKKSIDSGAGRKALRKTRKVQTKVPKLNPIR